MPIFWSKRTEVEFYGVDDNGRGQQWQYPAKKNDPPNTRLTGAHIVGNLLPVQGGTSGDPVLLWDARIGSPVDRTMPAGRAQVEDALRANGSPLTQRSEPNHYSLFRLDTGQSFPFFGDNPEETINVNPVGVTAARALWLKQGDNGGAGHSGFASSLWCSDGNGRVVWLFPTHTYYNGEFLDESGNLRNPGDYARLYRDVLDAVLCGSRTEEPVVVCLVRHGNAVWRDGVRVRDGKLLWSHPDPNMAKLAAAQSAGGTGAFFLHSRKAQNGDVQSVHLDYMDAITGKTRKIMSLPRTTSGLFATGDELITLDASVLRFYSVKKLLGIK